MKKTSKRNMTKKEILEELRFFATVLFYMGILLTVVAVETSILTSAAMFIVSIFFGGAICILNKQLKRCR